MTSPSSVSHFPAASFCVQDLLFQVLMTGPSSSAWCCRSQKGRDTAEGMLLLLGNLLHSTCQPLLNGKFPPCSWKLMPSGPQTIIWSDAFKNKSREWQHGWGHSLVPPYELDNSTWHKPLPHEEVWDPVTWKAQLYLNTLLEKVW